MRFVLTLAFCLMTGGAAAAADCSLKTIGDCGDTNELIWSSDFRPALKAFLGKRKVDWLGQRDKIADVVGEVLGGPPENAVKLEGDLIRFAGSRQHSAVERGVVLIATDGTIKAAGVLHFNCGKGCEESYTLSILLAAPDDRLAGLVKDWGAAEMKANAENGLDGGMAKIGKTEVLTPKG
jgi:hypothetical protein